MKFRILAVVGILLVILSFYLKNDKKSATYSTLSTQTNQSEVPEKLVQKQYVKVEIKKAKLKRRHVEVSQPLVVTIDHPQKDAEEDSTLHVDLGVSTVQSDEAVKNQNPWVVQKLTPAGPGCNSPDSCRPVGKDGVLLVGTSVLPQIQLTSWQGVLEMGQFGQRTPLLHVR